MRQNGTNESRTPKKTPKAQNSIVSYFTPVQKKTSDADSPDFNPPKKVKADSTGDVKVELGEKVMTLSKEAKIRDADPILRSELALLPDSWFNILYDEMKKPYFYEILKVINRDLALGKIYPPRDLVYNCLNYDYITTKVVIIGQDPYHGPNQAHGLCFSVNKNIKPPPSLMNIFQEIENDLGMDKFKRPNHGSLVGWRDQGVLLLNDSLTVRERSPMSHANIGWSKFTDFIISYLSKNIPHLVFMLWGSSAQSKWRKISTCTSNLNSHHLILTARHPSPLSANQGGWFGNKHFSKANEYLKANNKREIDWGYLP